MLSTCWFHCCVLGLILPIGFQAHAQYACDALPLTIATSANKPFSADVVISSWQIAPDGSKKQTGPSLIVPVGRDNSGRVLVKRPARFSSNEGSVKGAPDFWYTTICDPTGVVTRISQSVRFQEAVDPSTGKNVETVLLVDGTAKIGRGLRHISPEEFDQPRVPPSDRLEDLGYEYLDGVRAHGYRSWIASDDVIDESAFTDRWLSADLESGLSLIDTRSSIEDRTELTHLRREGPDPKLFQIPPDYKIVYSGDRRSLAPQEPGAAACKGKLPEVTP